jgi:hypothetical protein
MTNTKENDPMERIAIALERNTIALERIADLLEQQQPEAKAPNFTAKMQDFKNFDWGKIGATIEQSDQYGAAIVSFRGKQYQRRSPENAYTPAIYFSRCVGLDAGGKKVYERLITFKRPAEVNPVSRKVENMI